LAPRQLKEAERSEKADTGVACKLVQQREGMHAAGIFVCSDGELPLGVDPGGLIDHQAGGLEGLIVDGIELLDRRQSGLDGPYPQLGEALGFERLSCRSE
jgi:hypothetical protein